MAPAIPFIIGAMAVFGAISQVMKSQSQAGALRDEAHRERIRAHEAQLEATERARRLEREKRKSISRIRAKFGAAGVTSAGTPLLFEEEEEREFAHEIELTRRAGKITSGLLRQNAATLRGRASATSTAGFIKAGTSILGGAGKIAALP